MRAPGESLTEGIRRLVLGLGYDVSRAEPDSSEGVFVSQLLSRRAVKLVLDVGANTGKYGRLLRRHGYRGRIVSFEPLSTAYAQLVDRAARDPSWDVAPRMALGDRAGEALIHVSRNSVSSSLLPMLPAHQRAAPHSGYIADELTPVHRLEDAAAPYITEASPLFLKLDVQGYEGQVIEGSRGLLPRVVGIQAELSLVPLYEGACMMPEMSKRMQELGFVLYGVFPGFVDPSSGRMLQVDGVYMRES